MRRVAPRPFVGRERRPAGAGDDLVGEPSAVDRRHRALVAAQREGVLLLARDRRPRARGSRPPGRWSDRRRDSCRPASGSATILWPPIGTRLIDSVPPATMAVAKPAMIRSAAKAIDCRPDEQKRLMVTADALTGMPARRLAIRATFSPCSASGIAQPRITSSISAAIEARRAAQRRVDDERGHVVRPRVAQAAVRRLADGGPRRRDDDCFSHGRVPSAKSPSRSSSASPTSCVLPSNR